MRLISSICTVGAPYSIQDLDNNVDTLFLGEGGKRLGELGRLAGEPLTVCVFQRTAGLTGAGAGSTAVAGKGEARFPSPSKCILLAPLTSITLDTCTLPL